MIKERKRDFYVSFFITLLCYSMLLMFLSFQRTQKKEFLICILELLDLAQGVEKYLKVNGKRDPYNSFV
jgi:hypothetical protein